MTISRETLAATAVENFASICALAASSNPGCRDARKALKDAARFGLDTKPYAFFAAANGGAGATVGWSIIRCAGSTKAAIMIPKLDQMWSGK